MIEYGNVRYSRTKLVKTMALGAVLVLTMAVFFGMPLPMIQQAEAHKDPSNSNSNAVGGSVSVADQSDPGNPLPLGQVLVEGQQVQYNATLNEIPDFGSFVFAAFDGGSITITTPDGVANVVNPPPDVPCIGGTTNTGDVIGAEDCGAALSSFISDAAQYTVDCADVNEAGQLHTDAVYAGFSHSNTLDTLAASTSIQAENPCASTILTKDGNVTAGLLTDTQTSVAVKYTYTEENDGTDILHSANVTDDSCDPVTPVESGGFNVGDTNTDGQLNPGEVWQFACETSYNTTGTFTNTAIGNATTSDGQLVTYPLDQNETAQFTVDIFSASTNLTKTANETSVQIGDTVKFTFLESNDGTVDLNSVTVSDDQCTVTAVESGGFNVGDTNTDGLLNPGEIWEFSCEVTFTTPGTYLNNATATGTVTGTGTGVDGTVIDDSNDPDEAAQASVQVSGQPSTILTKEGNVTSGLLTDSVTEVAVHYIFNETNNGDLALDTVGVTDDQCSVTPVESGGFNVGDTNTNGILDTGETWQFECDYVFTSPGNYTNTANATGTVTGTGTNLDGTVVNQDTDEDEQASFNVEINYASTSLTKQANVTSGTAPLAVHYIFNETNDGTVDLDSVGVVDDQCTVTAIESGGFNVGDVNTDGLLNPGETWQFECDQVFNTAGSFTNTANATGTVAGDSGTVINQDNDSDEQAQVTVEVAGGAEGCTPGFWKNNAINWGAVAWESYTPSQRVDSVFTGALPSLGDDTLLQALQYHGGNGLSGAEQILLRAAVAALLNSANSNIDYPLSTAQVIAEVNAALASNDRATILALAAELDADNNLGCSVDQHGNPI